MSDYVISILRTVVPALWGALVAWLIGRGLPAEYAEQIGQLAVPLTAVAIACWYALARWAEPYLPAWLAGVLLGSPAAPSYGR